ncbi:MAG: DEAD/DEAH box helicase [Nanoarchaeota archaeon]
METENHEFKRLGISGHLLKSIEEHKFEEPTEIQEKSIPLILQGKDVIATSATGSGKTLVFSSVIVQNTMKNYGIQALILVPTRELAEQITRTVNKFAKHKELEVIPVYGGVSINEQVRSLKHAEVVVGTPGRILDHIKRQTINLLKLKILVLDEADRMFDMGFQKDVEKIINNCPRKRQTLLFSATMPKEIVMLTRKYMNDLIEISAEQYVDPTKLTQIYYDIDDKLKFSLLKQLLEKEESKLVMVFCNTRRNVDFVAKNLRFNNIEVLPIHGGFSQNKRNQVMEKFHSQKVQILVCTDVAARGLDIKGVTHIYNYDAPVDSKEYLHRIGRTARAGEEGKVINLISSRDRVNFNNILRNRDLEISNEQTPEIMPVRVKLSEEKNRGYNRFRRNNNQRSFGRKRAESLDRPFRKNRGHKRDNNGLRRFYKRTRNNRFSRSSRR